MTTLTVLTADQAYRLDHMNSGSYYGSLGTHVLAAETAINAFNNTLLATTLTGFTSGAGTLSSADNVLQAIQKLSGDLQNKTVLTNVLTGFVSGAGTVSSADTILGAIQKLVGNTQNLTVLANVLTGFSSGAGTVSSADTVLGAIQKLAGNTQNLTVLANVLTGFVSGAGTVSSSDTVLGAIQKNDGNIGVLKNGTFSVAGANAETSSTDAGAISISKLLTNISSAAAESRTLAAPGVAGQLKIIEMSVHVGDVTLALTNVLGNTAKTATFSAVGQSLVLVSVSAAYWALISAGGTAIA